MKVLLLRDVAKIGRRFEVVNVPDGFALNKLIPKGDAEMATPANMKKVEDQKKRTSTREGDLLSSLKTIVAEVDQVPLKIVVSTNNQGHLFKAIHEADITEAAKARGFLVPKELIIIEAPIKSVGEHRVTLKVKEKLSLSVTVEAK